MQLTPKQQQALEQGAAVDIILDGRSCVILSREAHDRLKEEYDAEPWTKEEMDLASAETADMLQGDGLDEPLQS